MEGKVITSVKPKVDGKEVMQKLEKDGDGYYRICLGYLNAFNVHGIYFMVSDPEGTLGPNSFLGRRVKNGLLYAELGHPEFKPNVSTEELKRRTIKIDLNNVAAHIRDIEVIETDKKEPGFDLPILKIMGWVKPSGPKKDILEEFLENPNANAAFSIRSLAKMKYLGNVVIKDVFLVSTFDFVYENGMRDATKWDTVANNSFDFTEIGSGVIDIKENEYDEIVAAVADSDVVKDCVDGKCFLNTIKKKISSHKYESEFSKWALSR